MCGQHSRVPAHLPPSHAGPEDLLRFAAGKLVCGDTLILFHVRVI